MDIALIHEEARQAHLAGLSILPPAEDGSKRPDVPAWAEYQTRRATSAELRGWYPGRAGLGTVCGEVSGNLEAVDFDDRATYDEFVAAAQATGLGDVVTRVEAGYVDDTPNGVRWLWRSERVEGNLKLARRPAVSGGGVETLIETKGTGGYAILAPSGGTVHPAGRPYVRRSGGFSTIATVTADEREALTDLARTFDQMPSRDPAGTPATSTPSGRPGDDYAARTSWLEILEPAGWTPVYSRAGTTYWRRPGKRFGVSATTGHAGSDLLFVFSSSTQFDSERSYSKFAALAQLEHGGDFKACAQSLRTRGFGAEPESAAPPTVTQAARATPPYGWKLLDDVELLGVPDPTFLIADFIVDGGLTVIVGHPASGKTTLTAALCGCIATQTPLFGRKVRASGPVVYVAAEDVPGFKRRLTTWKTYHGYDLNKVIGVHTLPNVVNLLLADHADQLLALVRPHAPRMIVVDTYAASMPGGNESASEDVTVVMDNANALRRALGCGVIFLHHLNATGTRERGHTALKGAADTMIVLSKEDDLVRVECEKQRNGTEFEAFDLRLLQPAGLDGAMLLPADTTPAADALTPSQRRALAALNEHFLDDGATKSDWQKSCRMAERTFFRASKGLVEAGYVVQRMQKFVAVRR